MPIENLYTRYMKTNSKSVGIRMKYTRYLIYSEKLADQWKPSRYKFVLWIQSFFELIRTFYLLGFCLALIPFAIVVDFGRYVYFIEIKTSRKLKHMTFVYNFRKSTVYIHNVRRLAYMLIQKTNSQFNL